MTSESIETEWLNPGEELSMERLLAKIGKASSEQLLQIAHVLKDIEFDMVFDIPGACRVLGCSRSTLFRRMQRGEIKPMLLHQRGRLFSSHEIYRYFRKQYPGNTWKEGRS